MEQKMTNPLFCRGECKLWILKQDIDILLVPPFVYDSPQMTENKTQMIDTNSCLSSDT